MTKKKPKKLTDKRRGWLRLNRIGIGHIWRYPASACIDAYVAGLRAGRREKR